MYWTSILYLYLLSWLVYPLPFSPIIHLLNSFFVILFLLSWFHSPSILLYVMIETFNFYCCCCLLELNYDITSKHILFNGYICTHDMILRGMNWLKTNKLTPLYALKNCFLNEFTHNYLYRSYLGQWITPCKILRLIYEKLE